MTFPTRGFCLPLSLVLLLVWQPDAAATNLLTETFDCPVPCQPGCDPACVAASTIIPLGAVTSADIVVENGLLKIPTCSVGDGARIEFPLSAQSGRHFQLDISIDENEFDHAEAYVIGVDVEEGGQTYRAIKIQALRDPGWNKCQIMVEIKDAEGKTQKSSIFFGCGQRFDNQACPGVRRVSFVWEKDEETGEEGARIEVRDENGDVTYLGRRKPLPFQHDDGKIIGVTILKVQPITLADGSPVPCGTLGDANGYSEGTDLPAGVVPQTDEGEEAAGSVARGLTCNFVGDPGFQFMIDTILVDSEDLDDGAPPPVTLTPDSGGQGETLDVLVQTREPMFLGTEEFDFGPNIAINSVNIIDTQTASLNVTIDPRSLAYRRVLVVNTGPTMADFGYSAPFEVLDVLPIPAVTPWALAFAISLLLIVVYKIRQRYGGVNHVDLPGRRLQNRRILTATLTCVTAAAGFTNSAFAETRCVTVTTADQAVKYTRRVYTCANPDGSASETHNVSNQLPVGGWVISANSEETMYFDVPCAEGKVVVGFSTDYLWTEAQDGGCVSKGGKRRLVLNNDNMLVLAPLGTVTSKLDCVKPGSSVAGVCELFTCPIDDETTLACFTPFDDSSGECVCLDPSSPIEGIDYIVGGEELEQQFVVAPAVTAWSVASMVALALLGGAAAGRSITRQRVRPNSFDSCD